MNFSEIIPHSGLIEYSKDSSLVAATKGNKLAVFTVEDTTRKHVWTLPDPPTSIQWSPDSSLIMTLHPKRSIIHLCSATDYEWSGKIMTAGAGLSGAFWSPDSTRVLGITDFQLRLSIWDLTDMSVVHIKNPKFPDKGLSFNSDGKFMALAERHECKDYVGIYFTGNWGVVNHFQVETFDLEDVKWNADDSALIVWDTCLTYQLLIYSPLGHMIARHHPYDNGLGVKSVSLSNDGKLLSVGSFDQELRLFSYISWKFVTSFMHKSSVQDLAGLHVYKEEEYQEGHAPTDAFTSRYVLQTPPVKLPVAKVPRDKPNPNLGVSCCHWSADGKYLATKEDSMPNAVWVWNITTLSLSVLMIHKNAVKSIAWNPKTLHLACCTGTGQLFIWSMEGASVCDVPLENKDFKINKLVWSADGQSLLLLDKARGLVAYPQFELLESRYEEYF